MRPNTWVLHGARALNSYLPLEFQSETQDYDWIVHESENVEEFIHFLNQKTYTTPEIVTTTHSSTISLSYFKVRVLDLMFVKTLPSIDDVSILEVPFSMTPNSLAPIMLPIPQTFRVPLLSFPKVVDTLQSCIHDVSDPSNEWRRVRDAKTMRKIVFCQSLGYQPNKPRWIPESMLDFTLGIQKRRFPVPAVPLVPAVPAAPSVPSVPAVPAVPAAPLARSSETQTETFEIQTQTSETQTETFEMQTETSEMQTETVAMADAETQTENVVVLTPAEKKRILQETSNMSISFSKTILERIKLVEEKYVRKHRQFKKELQKLQSACRYLYYGWRADISANKMYQHKLEVKFRRYSQMISMMKLLLSSLLENKSMVFKEWSFMNWAMFQDSFLRHLEWFSDEGIPGMVETQVWINDVPDWWKDQVNLFPFVSSTVSYAMFNFLQTNHKTTIDDDTFLAMKMSNDKTSINHLRLQNSYITKQLTQFTYDQCESKKFGWYLSDLPENLSTVRQEYDNSKIKMESLICLIVSSVLSHQVRNEKSDRIILVTFQRLLEKFHTSFSIELEPSPPTSLEELSSSQFSWTRPRPYYRFRNLVSATDSLDSFVKGLPNLGWKKKGHRFTFFKKKINLK